MAGASGFKAGFCRQRGFVFCMPVCTMRISPPQQGQVIFARFSGLGGLINTRVIN